MGKKQGISVFDFDDTLASTKSGVRGRVPNTDGSPKPNRKVIFLAGGAGSGKSNVVKKLGLEEQGFKIVNQDISLEWLKKNHGLPENMRELTKEQRSTLGKLGHQARGIARRKMLKFQGRGNGVVVDGTGASKKNMEKLVNEFKEKGYDVSMLFVETSLETALARNAARKERSLLDIIVRKNHESVMGNKEIYREMFGERFMDVKTDNLKMEDSMPLDLVSKMNDFVRGYERLRLDAEDFASMGESILARGGKFDFSEFNEVIDGTEGPLLKTALERAKKFGTKDMFILTARPAESAKAIQEFLKSQGLDIPLENITGLGNSAANAKAKWMLGKFSEGYNDMYFVDDAIQNVDAVKKVLDQVDVKSNIVQAKARFSNMMNVEFNKMLERRNKNVKAEREISAQEALLMGRGKGRYDYFVPPSAEDFKGLLYKFLGKGRQGDADMKFFKESLLRPFAEGIRDLTIVKQKMSEEYKTLKKKSKNVNLKKEIKGTPYTIDHAIRVHLWDKSGFEIPGISKEHKSKLLNYVRSNPELIAFAEMLSSISRVEKGYMEPGDYWGVESIASDLNQLVAGATRAKFLAEWIENKNIIFSEANMNKIEATHGPWFREALENILWRMESGTNRMVGTKDGVTKWFYDWVNGAVGATMFWNTRSAMLQTISTVNFVNWKENNPFAAASAFANQPQFWKDFAFIMNSPMLKQRRAGLQIDVSASELTTTFEQSGRNPKAILNYFLQKGFTPTRIADSFAIAMGGASYYRNRIKMYKRKGLTDVEAKKKAWLDFQEIAEETQQSSRPDLISQQQAGELGRVILAWQNTPMQMTRLMKKALSDLVNRRRMEGHTTQWQSDRSYISRILYYGAMQNLWFYTLQSGLGWLMFGSDQEEMIEKKELQVLNGSFDTLLRGTGIYGAMVSTLKNTILQYKAQRDMPYGKKDWGRPVIEMISLSPPIGSKVRKGYQAMKTWDYNKGVGAELGFSIENPNIHATANVIEGIFNVPLARTLNKANNLEEAITGAHEPWQRAAMILGWNRWNVGAKDEELEAARDIAEEKQKIEREQIRKEKKDEEKRQQKKEGFKDVRCSGRNSKGKRCSLTSWTKDKTYKCAHHMAFKDGMDRDGDGVKEYRCTFIKKDGKRCKMKGEFGKKKRCYHHD
jgi:predicted kinase